MIARKTWTNPYGYEEDYIWLWVTNHKSGHCWFGSAMETDSSCGNCDGARCYSCRDYWEVTEYAEPVPHYDPDWGYDYNDSKILSYHRFDSKEEAMMFFNSLKNG